MVLLLLNDLERACFGEVPGPPARYLAGENNSPAANEIRRLLLKIDLNRKSGLGAGESRAGEQQSHEENPFPPSHKKELTAISGKNSNRDGRFYCRMRVVVAQGEILEPEIADVFYRGIQVDPG